MRQGIERIRRRGFLPQLRTAGLALGGVLLLTGTWFPGMALAAGSASFSLSPTSGSYAPGATVTVSVYEDGSNVGSATVNLSYNASLLQCEGDSIGSAFSVYLPSIETCSGGAANLSAASSAALNGSELFATVTFKTLAAGSASVSVAAGSGAGATQIVDDTSDANVWDGGTPAATFTVSNPTAPPSGGGSSDGTSSPSGSAGSSKAGGTTSKPASTSTPAPPAPTSTTPTTPVPASTTQPPTQTRPAVTATAALTVTVLDTNGKPVRNAKVVLGGTTSAYTNAQGTVRFTGINSGAHSVTITASGKKATASTVTLAPGEDKDVSLRLANSTSSLVLSVFYVVVGLIVLGGGGFGYLKLSKGRLPFFRSGSAAPMAANPLAPVVPPMSHSLPPSSVITPTVPAAATGPAPAGSPTPVIPPANTPGTPASPPPTRVIGQ